MVETEENESGAGSLWPRAFVTLMWDHTRLSKQIFAVHMAGGSSTANQHSVHKVSAVPENSLRERAPAFKPDSKFLLKVHLRLFLAQSMHYA